MDKQNGKKEVERDFLNKSKLKKRWGGGGGGGGAGGYKHGILTQFLLWSARG